MANALCAWTTAPRNLLRGQFSKATAVIHLSVIDLPRAPIATIDAETLMGHWTDKGKWSPQMVTEITARVRNLKPSVSSAAGACHCEAGLMASFLSHSRAKPQSGGPSPDAGSQDAVDQEPGVLATVFQTKEIKTAFAVGVTKKSCPVCRMLGEILQKKYSLDVELPVQHTRYYRWVPPHCLPSEVLQSLEEHLLEVIMEMVDGERLLGNQMPSPASNRNVPLPDVPDMWAAYQRK